MQRVSFHSDFTWTRSDAPGKSRSKSVDITRVTTIRLLGIAHYPLKATCITGIIQFHLLSHKEEEQNTEMFFLSHWSVFSLCLHLFQVLFTTFTPHKRSCVLSSDLLVLYAYYAKTNQPTIPILQITTMGFNCILKKRRKKVLFSESQYLKF